MVNFNDFLTLLPLLDILEFYFNIKIVYATLKQPSKNLEGLNLRFFIFKKQQSTAWLPPHPTLQFLYIL